MFVTKEFLILYKGNWLLYENTFRDWGHKVKVAAYLPTKFITLRAFIFYTNVVDWVEQENVDLGEYLYHSSLSLQK